ncbi:MAG TPA: hydrogenase formation protein HypD [Kofleriaceae bacterium]|nr:hydrogenase formation protein HypD [Kofleriaceae bacterium]
MKYVDEFRDPGAARRLADDIARTTTRPWRVMEVCGGQTHAIVRYGLAELLPPTLELIHGPGCPVCVTPAAILDLAHDLAARPGVVLCTFGDMLRVPGTRTDLYGVKAAGGDVRVVYGPLDALHIAEAHPDRDVVFLAVGFETTAPANAMAVYQARQRGIGNFSMLVSHVLVPPALEALLAPSDRRLDGLLAAGHVCSVMGLDEYRPLAARHAVPIVVTGFEPLDILQGVAMCVRQLEAGRHEVENQYARAVAPDGNHHARALIREVFEVVDRDWRGIGEIAASGLGLRAAYADHDALRRFGPAPRVAAPATECLSGLVLQGRLRPTECPAFGTRCTPDRPLGAPMVSNEGACAAYYHHRRAAR